MRKSFILYLDMGRAVCKLRDAEAGRMIKAVFRYVNTGELPDNLRGGAEICFDIIRESIDRDWEKYDAVCKQRAEAGRAGGLKTQLRNREANQANAGSALANQADNENDNENENENENDNESESENENVPGALCRGPDSTPSPILYGKYRNLSFTPEEYEALQAEFPQDFEARLERLSEYIASSGKKYASALATIRAWARKETQDGNLDADHEQWSLGNVL